MTRLEPSTPVRGAGTGMAPCLAVCAFPSLQSLYFHELEFFVKSDDGSPISPLLVGGAVLAVLLVSLFLWVRERRHRVQRERLRKTYALGEEVLSSSSADSILKRLGESLPRILGVSKIHLYVYNRASKTLDAVAPPGVEPVVISLSAPPGGAQSGAVACFHYRSLLAIPDIERSPFPSTGQGQNSAKSLLFVPMMAQTDVIGVLELDQDDRTRVFTFAEQEMAQHLANQTGVALKLLDQRSVQEQLFRTEKLAAVGRLISGVVNELKSPLASISELAGRALEKAHTGPLERELAAIAAEARKATTMVSRLVSFESSEQVEANPVSVGSLLHSLIEFREREWKASGIQVRNHTSRDPLFVLGLHGQLEQVFLNLFVHVEQSLAEAPRKVITIRTSVLAKRLLVEISFTAPPKSRKAEETAAVLGVARSVIAGHGGEVRLNEQPNADPVFEVELPVAARDQIGSAASAPRQATEFARTMTALIVEPDKPAQRHLLGLLEARDYRVVPVDNSDTGLDLAQRIRFDLVFVSVHAPGLNWVELSERLQSRVGVFVLIPDRYDAELSADFEGAARFVLPKPVQEAELDRVLRSVEQFMAAAR